MAYYPDLSPCDYFRRIDPEGKLIAVGWLEPDHSYSTGEVDRHFASALGELLSDPWEEFSFRGFHTCACRRFSRRMVGFPLNKIERVQPNDLTARRGVYNLFVPGRGCVYVAPELILHYIVAHEYFPPKVFQAAVLSCPKMRSIAYFKAILKNGPRGLA